MLLLHYLLRFSEECFQSFILELQYSFILETEKELERIILLVLLE